MPLPYYAKLSDKDKRVYRKSAKISSIDLPKHAHATLVSKALALRAPLEEDRLRRLGRCANDLISSLCAAFEVPAPVVRVRAVRPRDQSEELHGLYTRWDDGSAEIEVWARTAAKEKPVAFRTFVRTLLHEVCHHLDYVLLRLPDTFHTEGFFQRESSLTRQLLGEREKPEEPAAKAKAREQLTLF